MLSEINPHEKDVLLTFEDKGHRYLYVPLMQPVPVSVTGLIKLVVDQFDGPGIVHKRFTAWSKDPTNKYYTLIEYLLHVQKLSRADAEKEILNLWDAKGKIAAEAGTQMHQVGWIHTIQ